MSSGVIDAHIAERLCEKRPLPTDLNYELEVLGRDEAETTRVFSLANSLGSSRKT
jgi:hypothetical protein